MTACSSLTGTGGVRRFISATKSGSLLKAAIPIRTFADWNEKQPCFLEVYLVAHCGESTKGFYLNTVDVAMGGWSAVGYGAKAMTGWVAPFTRWLGGCLSPC